MASPFQTQQPSRFESVEAIRAHFPALERQQRGQPVAYFDGPGGTQVPREVVGAISDYLLHHNANTHWAYPSSIETGDMITRAREVFSDFFNCSPREVAFGNNMTTITLHLSRALGAGWGPGDEIIVTELDHHANVAPWQRLSKERGVTLRTVPFDPGTGELAWDELERAVTDRTRLLAIGAASNALGTVSDVQKAAQLVHSHGALCFVDAVHYAAHLPIDVRNIDCDFLVCSPYKFYGPHAGVLFGRAELMSRLDVAKLLPAPDEIPDRLETGTQNHEGIAGSCAAVEFLASLADGPTRRKRLVHVLTALHERGAELFASLWKGLQSIPGITCYGPSPERPRTPTLSFTVAGVPSAEVARALAADGLFLSHGNFYAATVAERLGREDDGFVRVGCACYSTAEELERLVTSLKGLCGSRN